MLFKDPSDEKNITQYNSTSNEQILVLALPLISLA